MSEAAFIFESARLALSGALIGIGFVFMAGGALGMLRFPDFYTRLHAAGVSDAVGGVILIAGLAVASWEPAVVWKLLLLAALISASSPSIAHLSANAAHAGGLAPIAGAYKASREKRRGAKR